MKMNQFLKVLVGTIVASLFGGYIGYQAGYEDGYQEGITYQAQVDISNIVLGLIDMPYSGYYIVNQNYGNFKLNVTNQTEALKYLQKEISPCL
jgi:hypothetical protein